MAVVIKPYKQEMLDAELETGETLLWTGQPHALRAVREASIHLIFGVMWTAFTLGFTDIWYGSPDSDPRFLSGESAGFILLMLVFLSTGFGMMAWPFIVYARFTKTVYGITNKRILIIVGGRSRQVESFGRDDLGRIKRIERADKTGDLIFAQKYYKDSDGDKQVQNIEFIGIPEVRAVEVLMRRALAVEGNVLNIVNFKNYNSRDYEQRRP